MEDRLFHRYYYLAASILFICLLHCFDRMLGPDLEMVAPSGLDVALTEYHSGIANKAQEV